MKAIEVISACQNESHWQLFVSQFVDDFRRAAPDDRAEMIAEGPKKNGSFEGLIAAVVSVLCREAAMPVPEWVQYTHSPDPFFALPAKSFALRVRLMLESPPAFRGRHVFVPENYLQRA